MLRKFNRLAKSKDVKRALALGRSYFSPFFSLKFFPQKDGLPRFTFVVSTRVSKKAVDRNRLKRILRELVRKHLPKFIPGDYAVIIKPASVKNPEADVLKAFQTLVIQKGLLK